MSNSYVSHYQRVNLHFPMFFLWFSMVFLWFSYGFLWMAIKKAWVLPRIHEAESGWVGLGLVIIPWDASESSESWGPRVILHPQTFKVGPLAKIAFSWWITTISLWFMDVYGSYNHSQMGFVNQLMALGYLGSFLVIKHSNGHEPRCGHCMFSGQLPAKSKPQVGSW